MHHVGFSQNIGKNFLTRSVIKHQDKLSAQNLSDSVSGIPSVLSINVDSMYISLEQGTMD